MNVISRQHGHSVCEAVSRRTGAEIRAGQKMQLLPHAATYFPEVFASIAGARQSIDVELYRVVHPSQLASELVDILMERADAGVSVTLVLDGVGCRTLQRAEAERWRRRGIKVCIFNPIEPHAVLRLGTRNHRKLVLVDGATAFTGGMSVDDSFAHHASAPWRETMIRVEGPVVADMRNALVTCATMCTPAGAPSPSMTHGARIGDADAQYVVSTPHDRNAVAMYLEALRLAKRTVHITTPYFIPPPEIVDALTSAAMRGVDVRVLTAGGANKLRIARAVSRLVYGECLSAGVRIFEYQPTMLHAKCTVVDGVWATIGSVNLDARSLWRNLEANLVTCDETIAAAMEREFFNDLGQAEEITLGAWRRRPVAERVFGVAALPLRSHL